MNFSKDLLISSLPIRAGELSIRHLIRADMDQLSKWPNYLWPHDVFRFSFSSYDIDQMNRAFEMRTRNMDRITLVVDTSEAKVIGYVALVQVDWGARISGNMSFRIHPEFCDRGVGSRVMSMVRDWCFGQGMEVLRLDVAATNQRAIKCYLNAGFQKAEEFWREAHDLVGKNLSEQKYNFLEGHLDDSAEIPRIRFYWMVAKNSQQSPSADRAAEAKC
jgi:RimJ/RimL family protein N-acetyltransferase